jgi:hypothetical protein
MGKIMDFVEKHDTILFYLGLVLMCLFIIGLGLVGIGNAYASAPTYNNIKADNTNTLGYVLVGTGTTNGGTQVGDWQSISNLGFATTTALNAEANVRYTTDSQLQTSISTEQMRALVSESNITTNLNNEITNRKTDISNLTDNLNAEAKDRTNADNILQSGIDSVKSDLGTESIVREKADNTLQDNINTEQFDRIAMVNNEAISRVNGDNLLQNNINTEANTRASADNQLNSRINDTNSRVDNVEHRLGKLERTQYVVRGELKFIREKHLEVGVYSEYNVGRNVCSEVGLNVVIPIGESYLDRENKRINTRLDRIERNLGQSTVIERVVDKKGKVKSISISQGQLLVNGQF